MNFFFDKNYILNYAYIGNHRDKSIENVNKDLNLVSENEILRVNFSMSDEISNSYSTQI